MCGQVVELAGDKISESPTLVLREWSTKSRTAMILNIRRITLNYVKSNNVIKISYTNENNYVDENRKKCNTENTFGGGRRRRLNRPHHVSRDYPANHIT